MTRLGACRCALLAWPGLARLALVVRRLVSLAPSLSEVVLELAEAQ